MGKRKNFSLLSALQHINKPRSTQGFPSPPGFILAFAAKLTESYRTVKSNCLKWLFTPQSISLSYLIHREYSKAEFRKDHSSITQYSPAVKSLLRSMKALEWGTRMLTLELRAFWHVCFLKNKNKSTVYTDLSWHCQQEQTFRQQPYLPLR